MDRTAACPSVRRGLAALVFLMNLTACAVPAPSPAAPTPGLKPTPTPARVSAPRFDPAACPFVLPEDYRDSDQVDCGWLTVPEDRDHLPSRALQLAVAIFHPAGGATAPDPVVFLSGGPGGSALEFLRYQFAEVFEPVLVATGRDLILFDQRGVGVSRPALDCPNVDALGLDLLDGDVAGQPVADQAAADLIAAAYAACALDLSGKTDLSTYHSAASAADVRDLRLALGYAEVNLWGGSYGTRLALEVMRRYPQGVRSAVLDSVYPPDVDLYAEGPANFARALDRLFASCRANAVCHQSHPALEADFFETVQRLNAEPASGVITDTLTGEGYAASFSGDALLGFVFSVLYETDLRAMLPRLMADAQHGDFIAINRIRGAILAQRTMMSRGMSFSVQCHDEIAFSAPERLERALADYPQVAGLYGAAATGRLAYHVCAAWPSGRADASADEPVVSEIPALLMAGEFDPITPPAWARHAARTLANGHVVEFPGVGHGASAVPGCPRDTLVAFVQDPGARPDEACLRGMQTAP